MQEGQQGVNELSRLRYAIAAKPHFPPRRRSIRDRTQLAVHDETQLAVRKTLFVSFLLFKKKKFFYFMKKGRSNKKCFSAGPLGARKHFFPGTRLRVWGHALVPLEKVFLAPFPPGAPSRRSHVAEIAFSRASASSRGDSTPEPRVAVSHPAGTLYATESRLAGSCYFLAFS